MYRYKLFPNRYGKGKGSRIAKTILNSSLLSSTSDYELYDVTTALDCELCDYCIPRDVLAYMNESWLIWGAIEKKKSLLSLALLVHSGCYSKIP